jgi:hypothetical protein
MHTYRFVVGDWSDDGHEKKDFFHVKTSHLVGPIREAYKRAVVRFDFALHHNDRRHAEELSVPIVGHSASTEYGHHVNRAGMDYILEKMGKGAGDMLSPDIYLEIFMWMVGQELENFTWRKINPPESINGFWNKGMNVSFGYEYYMD